MFPPTLGLPGSTACTHWSRLFFHAFLTERKPGISPWTKPWTSSLASVPLELEIYLADVDPIAVAGDHRCKGIVASLRLIENMPTDQVVRFGE